MLWMKNILWPWILFILLILSNANVSDFSSIFTSSFIFILTPLASIGFYFDFSKETAFQKVFMISYLTNEMDVSRPYLSGPLTCTEIYQQLVPSWNCPFLHPPTMSSPHFLLTSILSASFIGVSFSRISSLTLSILYLWVISFTFLKIINKFLFPTLTSPSCFRLIYSTSVETSVT